MGKNVTEQQRIAAALESMVDTSGEESTKKNVTEQQRIASALEAMAEGGGGSGGETPVYVHLKQENNTWQLDGITFDELMALCKAEKCLGALAVDETDGHVFGNAFPLHSYSDQYEVAVYFKSTYAVGNELQSISYAVRPNGINYAYNRYTLTEAT